MTATSAVIEGSTPAAPARWRIAWTRREDDRRRRAYDEAVHAWHQHREHLLRLQIEAAGFHGCHPARDSLPVRFEDDEVVFRVVPTARLVEVPARHVRGLPVPDLKVGANATQLDGRLPRGFRTVAAGTAVITDRRVTFAGPDLRREWRYADVTGIAHHPDVPLTLLHTFDCRRLAGLLAEPAGALNTRFYLTLAFAAATGRRDAVAAEIDTLLTEHQAARPAPPAPARPSDAPLTALRPDRRIGSAVAAAVTLIALTAGVVDAEPAERPHRAEIPASLPGTTDRPGPAAVVLPLPTASPAPPTATPVPLPPGTGPRPPKAPPAAPRAWATVAPVASVGLDRKPATGPGVSTAPATPPPPSAAPTAPPSATPVPTATPTPTTANLITVCVGVVELPIVDPLLCPGD